MDMGQARENPSSRNKARLPLSVHQPPRIPRNAYCDSVPNSWSHRSSSPISLPTHLWGLPPGGTEYHGCARCDLQFGVQECIVNNRPSELGTSDEEHSLPSIQ